MKPATAFRRRVILGWSGGRKYQGGTGAYRTDGPVVPDLIYATTSTINQLGRSSESRMIGQRVVERRTPPWQCATAFSSASSSEPADPEDRMQARDHAVDPGGDRPNSADPAEAACPRRARAGPCEARSAESGRKHQGSRGRCDGRRGRARRAGFGRAARSSRPPPAIPASGLPWRPR